ncbi:TetR/AcrR family transcriptional regulator [Sphaerisporangium corydalis]|uniref:TetR/AcrR family transcriptional regulator n=1 Tax=Sphaerisporangium corydalis TaxID=1441875 RepID=A0ABV9EHA3_9ACTN|nr:helix-turn-helix domain-containing protein [Sphaerisporangium corydalis]
MGRLSRAESQELNRARVLAAAMEEFSERGFRDAKIDVIAERAELTRGGVYSNFPGKRALYFAVLADLAERAAGSPDSDSADRAPGSPRPGSSRSDPAGRASGPSHPGSANSGSADGAPGPSHTGRSSPGDAARQALGAFARAWVARLPLATDERRDPARLGMDLMPEVLSDEHIRRPYAQLMKLDAILLGLALERLAPHAARMVRVAEAALTTLHGAGQLAAAAPGFVDPFDIVRVCEEIAGLGLDDVWSPPHLAYAPRAVPADQAWSPPPSMDAMRGEPARLTGDGVVAILGLHRLEAAEEAVRAAPPGVTVTAVLVTGDPAELAPLARLTIADLRGCLRQAFAPPAWPRLQVVYDEAGVLAAAAGVPAVSDGTEVAVRVEAGRITARADGRGACHAAASSGGPAPR